MEPTKSNWNDDRLDHFAELVDRRFDQFEARVEKRFDALQRSMIITVASMLAGFTGLFAALHF